VAKLTLDQGSPIITKILLQTFATLSLDKPDLANNEQETAYLFLGRFGLHSLTLWDVFFPNRRELASTIKEDVILSSPVDFVAAGVVTRSLYETFLTAHYLLHPKADANERECRYLAWTIYGFGQRDRLRGLLRSIASGSSTPSEDIRKLTVELERNSFFQSLGQKQKRKLLDEGMSMSLEDIAGCAKCPTSFHKYLQKQLSSFVHGDSHAFHQLLVADQKSMRIVAHLHFFFVASLMLDLTRQHIFTDEIRSDKKLTAVIDGGMQMVRDFDTLIPPREKV
jgi:hypothetical protein